MQSCCHTSLFVARTGRSINHKRNGILLSKIRRSVFRRLWRTIIPCVLLRVLHRDFLHKFLHKITRVSVFRNFIIMLSLGTRRTRRFHRSPVEIWLNFIHPGSSCYCRRCITSRRGDEAQRRAMSLSSPVIVPAKTMRTTRPRESTIACRPPSSIIGVASTSRMKLAHEEERTLNPVLSWTRVSPPPRVQQSKCLTLASRAVTRRVLNSLSPSFNPRSSLTLSCPPHPSKASREQDEQGEEEGALSSSRARSPQLSSARPNASPYYPRLAVYRRLHWRRAWQAEATLASTLLTPCNPRPRLARAPPYVAIRAHPAGASAVSGETYILRRAESTTEEEGEKRACDARLRDAMRGGAPHEPTRSKQLCRRGGWAATERDDGRC